MGCVVWPGEHVTQRSLQQRDQAHLQLETHLPGSGFGHALLFRCPVSSRAAK